MLKGEERSILQVVGKIVKNIQPIPVELSEVNVSTTYFQCVFARVKPNLELLRASGPQHVRSPHELGLRQYSFKADRIGVIKAGSLNPKTWKRVAEFTL